MGIYYVFMGVILLVQAAVMLEAWRHVVYTWRKRKPKPAKYTPRTALVCPCKGIDTAFDRNIQSLFDLDYPDYEIFFVVEDKDDPAYTRLQEILRRNSSRNISPVTPFTSDHSPVAHILIAGQATTSSQKVHNLTYVCSRLSRDFSVLAFVDSDACLKPHFLAALVHPLRRSDVGASTGYRWFVPLDNRLSSVCLSAMNAFFASLLGPHNWNSAWGGSMALLRETYDKLALAQKWRYSLTDDYTLTRAVKENNLQVAFVPTCFVASYEKVSWSQLFRFARRQFIITRLYMPHLWWLAILGVGHFLAGFWIGLFVTLSLYIQHSHQADYALILPLSLFILAAAKALMRQFLIGLILPEDRRRLFLPALLDVFLQPFVSLFTLICLLAAGFTRTIEWRGIRYVVRGPQDLQIIRE